MNTIGIDPGKCGGITIITSDLLFILPTSIEKLTEADINYLIMGFKSMGACHCFIEKVGAARGQGVTSMFTFGQNYGFWRGLLTAHQIPFEEVAPTVWQPAMKCKTRGKSTKDEHKRQLKQRAQQLFPSIDITLATADALLIAEYGRRVLNSRSRQ